MQIGDITVSQATIKLHTSGDGGWLVGAHRKRPEFIKAHRLKSRRGGRKKYVCASDDMTFNAFGKWIVRGHIHSTGSAQCFVDKRYCQNLWSIIVI